MENGWIGGDRSLLRLRPRDRNVENSAGVHFPEAAPGVWKKPDDHHGHTWHGFFFAGPGVKAESTPGPPDTSDGQHPLQGLCSCALESKLASNDGGSWRSYPVVHKCGGPAHGSPLFLQRFWWPHIKTELVMFILLCKIIFIQSSLTIRKS